MLPEIKNANHVTVLVYSTRLPLVSECLYHSERERGRERK